MRLTKIVFREQVSGIFGEGVSSLVTEPSPSQRQVAALEVTPLGLVVTRLDGERRLVPLHLCGTGELPKLEAEEGYVFRQSDFMPPGDEALAGAPDTAPLPEAKRQPGPRAKAR